MPLLFNLIVIFSSIKVRRIEVPDIQTTMAGREELGVLSVGPLCM